MKTGFSATEFFKRAIEFEEQENQKQPDIAKAKEKKNLNIQKPRVDAPNIPSNEIPSKIDNLKIDKNFYKVPNVVDDIIIPTLSITEEIIYRRLIRLSWGWGRNYCRAGINYFQETSGINSRTTIKSAIDKLLERGIIYRYEDADGQTDRNQDGTVYIIPIPSIPINGIPNIGIPENGIPKYGIPAKANVFKASGDGVPNIGIPENGIPKYGIPINDPLGVPSIGIPKNGTPDKNQVNTSVEVGVPKYGIPIDGTPSLKDIFKDSLKDTLSLNSLSQEEIIFCFYNRIGQKKLTKAKRERARECIKELIQEGFSIEDISFAVEWTLNNPKEEIYDFSILKHTISQAMAEKEKTEEIQSRLRKQEQITAQEKAEEERLEKEREEIEAFKAKMDSKARVELHQKALEEIEKMEGVKKEFVTDGFIRAKENEILKSNMNTIIPQS